jgi:Protein of unknown function (DUF2892)
MGRESGIDRFVLAWAGIVVLVSVALGVIVHPYWFGLTAFAGANLLQSSFTGFCPVATLLRKLGVPSRPAF